jgi:hypothetical protein
MYIESVEEKRTPHSLILINPILTRASLGVQYLVARSTMYL